MTPLLDLIEAFVAERDIAATSFSREFTGDPTFLTCLRAGRKPRRKTEAKIRAAIAARIAEEML